MTELTTIWEIKQAVDKGLVVYADSERYQVIKDNKGSYLIVSGDFCIGLHGKPGTRYENQLNAKFFYHV